VDLLFLLRKHIGLRFVLGVPDVSLASHEQIDGLLFGLAHQIVKVLVHNLASILVTLLLFPFSRYIALL
jgi:hypothetical protein